MAHAVAHSLLLATGTGIRGGGLWSVGPVEVGRTLTSVPHRFQMLTSPQMKATVAAIRIEFGPFLRVSCSHQGSDKLISQGY